MQAIGYRQVVEHLCGESARGNHRTGFKSTMCSLPSGKLTWFRAQKNLEWIELKPDESLEKCAQKICACGDSEVNLPGIMTQGISVWRVRLPCRTKRALLCGRMNFFVQCSELRDLYDKVAAGERISEADALRLFELKDLNTVGATVRTSMEFSSDLVRVFCPFERMDRRRPPVAILHPCRPPRAVPRRQRWGPASVDAVPFEAAIHRSGPRHTSSWPAATGAVRGSTLQMIRSNELSAIRGAIWHE